LFSKINLLTLPRYLKVRRKRKIKWMINMRKTIMKMYNLGLVFIVKTIDQFLSKKTRKIFKIKKFKIIIFIVARNKLMFEMISMMILSRKFQIKINRTILIKFKLTEKLALKYNLNSNTSKLKVSKKLINQL